MAIAEMEKLALTFNETYLDEILRLIQGFQGVHIEMGFEASIPPDKKAEINKMIRETEKSLQEIQTAVGIIKERKPTKMLGSLRNSEEKKLSIPLFTKIVEESQWETILEEVIHTDRWLQDNRKRRKEVTRLQNEMKIWEHLSCNPLDFGQLHRTTAFFGSIHEKHDYEFSQVLTKHKEDGVAYERTLHVEDRVYYLLLCHNSFVERLNIYMSEFSFSTEEYPFDKPPNEAKKELELEEEKLIGHDKEINRLIAEQSKYEETLAFAEDYNLNALLRQRISLDVTYDGDEVGIEGWIVSDKRGQFERLIAKHIPVGDYRLSINPVKDTEVDDVPIKLKNSRLATVYERLTEMYSLPRYNEIDPTPVITVFYLIFFGLMVADIGYGLAIFLIGLLVRMVLKVKRSTRSFVDFLYFLSFPIMAWGLVFGSFCGLNLPFGLLSATEDIIPMTVISIALGYLHIMTGLLLYILNQIKLGKYFDMASGGLAWFLVFLGGGIMLLSNVAPWFDGGILFIAGAVITGSGAAMVIICPAIQYGKRWLAGVGKGLYALYGATSYLGDFISYARLMALGVAGGSVALAFNTILAFLPLAARLTLGVALAVILHALNIFLSMLSAYVHGIRLQFIEFFGKFYTGGGKKFEPFKAAEKNVIIIDAEDG